MPLQRAADLLQAADKYGLVGCLKPLLEEHICGMVDASNVARVLAMADLHGAELIKKHISSVGECCVSKFNPRSIEECMRIMSQDHEP